MIYNGKFDRKHIFAFFAILLLLITLAVIFYYLNVANPEATAVGDINTYQLISDLFSHIAIYFCIGVTAYCVFTKTTKFAVIISIILMFVQYLAEYFIFMASFDEITLEYYSSIVDNFGLVIFIVSMRMFAVSFFMYLIGVLALMIMRNLLPAPKKLLPAIITSVIIMVSEEIYYVVMSFTLEEEVAEGMPYTYIKVFIFGLIGIAVAVLGRLLPELSNANDREGPLYQAKKNAEIIDSTGNNQVTENPEDNLIQESTDNNISQDAEKQE